MKRREFIKIGIAGSMYYLIPGLGLTSCTKSIYDPLDTPFEPDFFSPVDLDEAEGGFYVEYIRGKNYRPTDLSLDTWRLTVAEEHASLRTREMNFNLDEILQAVSSLANDQPGIERTFCNTFQCVGNTPGGHLISNGYFTGVPLADLFHQMGFDLSQSDLQRIYFRCHDGYSTNHKLARVLQDEQTPIYFVTRFNGIPLSDRRDGSMKHGFPVRIVTQGMLGMKSPKALTEILLSDRDDIEGWWETRPANRAFPNRFWADEPYLKINSKITSPVNYQKIKPGTDVLIHGVAMSGHVPVQKVEVGYAKASSLENITWADARIREKPTSSARPIYDDSDGVDFQEAVTNLNADVWPAPHVWCTWDLPWRTPGREGDYLLVVRATDANGVMQPAHETIAEKADGENAQHVLTVKVEK
ncbi:MAG: hypothetical protein DWQ10_17885 [Calditrichaeota bacterium]|nr:MAG: hypothetical protein DWQ10_17885 [Calditrichota bacterium]